MMLSHEQQLFWTKGFWEDLLKIVSYIFLCKKKHDTANMLKTNDYLQRNQFYFSLIAKTNNMNFFHTNQNCLSSALRCNSLLL